MEKLFLKIFDFFAKGRRKWAVIIPLALSLLFVVAALKINLNDDIAGFLPYGNGKSHKQSQFIYKNLRMADRIVLILSADEIEKSEDKVTFLTSAADQFVGRFEESELEGVRDPKLMVDASEYLAGADFIVANMPYFLEKEDYTIMDSVLSSGGFQAIFDENKEQILSEAGPFVQNIILRDPFHFSAPLLKKISRMGMDGGYKIIGDYIFTSDSSRIIMSLASEFGGSETKRNSHLTERLKELGDSTVLRNEGLKITLLGSPVIAVENAGRIGVDAVRCAVLSLLLIIVLLAWYFKRIKPILLICLPVVFGVLLGLAFMGVFAGDVSSVALSAACVIFGIGVDYALLYSARLGYVSSPKEALKDIVSPMVIGNITTVGAFFSLLLMSAAGMRDFGLFAAISLIGAILFVILFLPHWVGDKQYKSKEDGWLARWVNIRWEERRFVIPVILILSIVFLVYSFDVKFSGDFTKINYMTPGQTRDMEEFNAHSAISGTVAVYAVAQGNTLEEALVSYESVLPFAKESVAEGLSFQSKGIECFLPSENMQRERIARWDKWRNEHKNELLQIVDTYAVKAGFTLEAFNSFKALLDKEFTVVSNEYFEPLTSQFLSGFLMRDTSGKSLIMTILYTPQENLQALYDKFRAGEYKAGSIAEEPFLFDSYSMTDEMIDVLQEDFDWVLLVCSCLVFIFLWIALRRLELVCAAFFPMALSWIWITGLMRIFGVEFNIVNIILATFIFGLGDDYTIFMLEGLSYEYATGKKMLASYKTGVTLSAITMFIGVGSLMFAVHPALNSLGKVAVIGMLCVVFMAFLIPPMIFRWLTKVKGENGVRDRYIPLRLNDILITIFNGVVFAVICIYYKVMILVNRRLGDEKFRNIIHRRMRWFARKMPRVKMKVSGRLDIGKPCLIACNHQSHLDIMYLLALSPKLVFLTNKWVSKSPVYSDIIRKLGFICIHDSVDTQMDEIRRAVEAGYSVVIFPEGTRSEDCSIMKFHSGIFHIASELKLDILPVIVHGIGHVLPKHDACFRPGEVSIAIKRKIPYSDLQNYGDGNIRMARALERYYIVEYEKLRQECETLSYLKEKILGLYLYKGAELQKLVRKQYNQSVANGIEKTIAALPENAEVSLDANGTALEAVMYCMLRKDIRVTVCRCDDEFVRNLAEMISKEFGGRMNVV